MSVVHRHPPLAGLALEVLQSISFTRREGITGVSEPEEHYSVSVDQEGSFLTDLWQ